jgi:hypothetical protein
MEVAAVPGISLSTSVRISLEIADGENMIEHLAA